MSKAAAAQARVDAANAAYLELVRATRPFSRTVVQELRIQNAWRELEDARFWLTYAENEERNNARLIR